MIGYDRKVVALAVALSMLAGFVDAVGFINLGGLFVSFMSGNSTRLAVGIAEGAYGTALLAGGLIALFVAGVVLGTLTGRAAKARHVPAVLALVAALLTAAALSYTFGLSTWPIIFIVLAMGAENAAFERNGEVSISLTYMTGTLVKIGQRLAAALTGGSKWAWARYALLWLGLMCGAVAGSFAYMAWGLAALWGAVTLSLILCFCAIRIGDKN